ncbi:FAD-linked oxidase C-terminal domain-containing protein [Roseimicrobium sp. ORNL1]|uniref:FAD-binding oxidoreductase n=1 Tax=Roseimicrobium sp. ORNL1 TaxID=2711231 RepID=UPI0013E0F597|nr:FAD-linked oxidase C-terminal domain-containing protein [Roseimicrobium sp. ORNL1]QIF02512.1 FAD-binding protein [Roseimicrobium sp. ORNL1]
MATAVSSAPASANPLPATVLAELQGIVGAEAVLTADEDLIPYSFDGTAALKHRPACVVFPRSTEEVSACVKLAARVGRPVVTRGSGTGLSGGSVPLGGCIVLCMVKLDRILELDQKNLTMRVQCGVITKEIDDAAGKHGLFYPPDPGSMKISTIGGNVAENSGGLRGLKYGVTRDYIMGMTVVLPDGEISRLGNKCVKDVAGYSLKDLFIGSEGTLGIITEVLLKLLPRPAARRTMLAMYDSMEAAAETVSAIIAARIIPCTLEFLDRMTVQCVEDYARIGLPTDVEALLLMETDGHPAAVEDEASRMMEIARTHGAREVKMAADDAEGARLASARRNAFSALARVKPTTILEDVTVPRSELARMVKFINATAAKHRLLIGTFGHMGDGNLHPTFLTNEKDTEEMHRVELALQEIVDETLAVGGTVTGEHGVGLAKKAFLRQQFGDVSYTLLQKVKRALDPSGLLNPGKIFD